MSMIRKSQKLINVCYDIRGPVLEEAKRLEDEGSRIIKLNIGNPAPFGFEAPEEIVQDVILNLPNAQGYCDSKGLFAARKAVMHESQRKNIKNVTIEDIYIGNGVSELIVMAMQGLLTKLMKCSSRLPITLFGPLPHLYLVAHLCIIAVMRTMAGNPTLKIWLPKLLIARAALW